jgi:hypothetical protein
MATWNASSASNVQRAQWQPAEAKKTKLPAKAKPTRVKYKKKDASVLSNDDAKNYLVGASKEENVTSLAKKIVVAGYNYKMVSELEVTNERTWKIKLTGGEQQSKLTNCNSISGAAKHLLQIGFPPDQMDEFRSKVDGLLQNTNKTPGKLLTEMDGILNKSRTSIVTPEKPRVTQKSSQTLREVLEDTQHLMKTVEEKIKQHGGSISKPTDQTSTGQPIHSVSEVTKRQNREKRLVSERQLKKQIAEEKETIEKFDAQVKAMSENSPLREAPAVQSWETTKPKWKENLARLEKEVVEFSMEMDNDENVTKRCEAMEKEIRKKSSKDTPEQKEQLDGMLKYAENNDEAMNHSGPSYRAFILKAILHSLDKPAMFGNGGTGTYGERFILHHLQRSAMLILCSIHHFHIQQIFFLVRLVRLSCLHQR